MFYFGCIETTGHYWWAPGPERCQRPTLCPWVIIDLTTLRGHKGWDQTEGIAHLKHRDGWTLLGFWDRPVDDRFGSNSVFVTDNILSGDEMLQQAREAFPGVWARYPFEVRIGNEWDREKRL